MHGHTTEGGPLANPHYRRATAALQEILNVLVGIHEEDAEDVCLQERSNIAASVCALLGVKPDTKYFENLRRLLEQQLGKKVDVIPLGGWDITVDTDEMEEGEQKSQN